LSTPHAEAIENAGKVGMYDPEMRGWSEWRLPTGDR